MKCIATVVLVLCAGVVHASCPSILTVARFDKDGSRSLLIEEFQQLARWRFQKLDSDKDTMLSASEWPVGDLHPVFKNYLPHNVTRAEFEQAIAPLFAAIDTNQNHILERAEYRRFCRLGFAF